MSEIICYLNNIPMTSSQCKLFDLYEKYLQEKVAKESFINFEGYGDTFKKPNQYMKK